MRWPGLIVALVMLPGCNPHRFGAGGPDLHEVRVVAVARSRLAPWGAGGRLQVASGAALRVAFTAERNLVRFAQHFNVPIWSEVGLCHDDQVDPERRLASLGVTDAVTNRNPDVISTTAPELAGDHRLYHLYVAERTDGARLNQGDRGAATVRWLDHDLRQEPVDICFRLSGNNFGLRFRSNTLRIPAAAIRAALVAAPP